MSEHVARLESKDSQRTIVTLKMRREKPDDPVAEYIVYLGKLYRVHAHSMLDENSTVVSTYKEVSQRVVVYS